MLSWMPLATLRNCSSLIPSRIIHMPTASENSRLSGRATPQYLTSPSAGRRPCQWTFCRATLPTRGVAPMLPRHGAPQRSPPLVQGRQWVMVAWKNQCEYDEGWGIPGSILDDPGPIKLSLSPARYTTSAGAVRDSWCLQVHVASAFSRGVQRTVDHSRGAAVIS